jgi:hypothetical protein
MNRIAGRVAGSPQSVVVEPRPIEGGSAGSSPVAPPRRARRAGRDFLSQKRIEAIVRGGQPGYFADGHGLYFRLALPRSTTWIYRYMAAGKRFDVPLGPLPAIGLADARERAAQQARLRADGADPRAQYRAARVTVEAVTFRDCAEKYIASKTAGWRGGKNESQ